MTRKRRLILTLTIAGTALLLWIFLASREPQPSYQGRTLSQWLIAYQNDRSRSDAPTAVHNIGTNALPVLVKWLTYKWPRWRVRVNEAAARIGGQPLLRLVAGSRAERQSAALVGFEILGPEAAPAIPALTNHFDWSFLYGVNDMIFVALNRMGNDGLAPLLAVATNKTVPAEMRAHAVTRVRDPLMRVDTNANWAVPVLVDLLKDPMTGARAAVTLGDLRLDPPVAVPALTACAQDKGAWYNVNAAESLGRFGKEATSAVPVLVEALSSTNRYLRMAATNALESIAPEVLKKEGK